MLCHTASKCQMKVRRVSARNGTILGPEFVVFLHCSEPYLKISPMKFHGKYIENKSLWCVNSYDRIRTFSNEDQGLLSS